LKLQCLQNKVFGTIGYFPRRTPVGDLHVTFKIPYVYDFITKLCRQQAEVMQNHHNPNVPNIGQGEAQYRKYKINLVAVKPTTVQVTKLPLQRNVR
jgi:hypothetical protein